MKTYEISIYSNDAEPIHIRLDSTTDEIDFSKVPLVQDLKLIFTTDPLLADGRIIIGKIENAHYNNVAKLVQKHAHINIPQLKGLPSKIGKFTNGNHYAIAFNRPLNTNEFVALMTQLEAMDKNMPVQSLFQQLNDTCGEVLSHYDFIGQEGTKRWSAGPSVRSERVCRYCHRSMPEVKFDNIAHTISEGLENKNIITNDECDICNDYFGKNVEPHLLEYVSLFRVMFNVQGKKGKIHHIYGENYEVINKQDGKNSIDINIRTEYADGDQIPYITEQPVELISQNDIIMQNVYKSLVKYALGILPPDKLKSFSRTVEWLLGNITITDLPLVRLSISPVKIDHPNVMVFIRKSQDETLPYAMAELNVINLKFVYIIPLCDNTDVRFLDPNSVNRINEVFKGYAATHWQALNLSSNVPMKFKNRIYFSLSQEER